MASTLNESIHRRPPEKTNPAGEKDSLQGLTYNYTIQPSFRTQFL